MFLTRLKLDGGCAAVRRDLASAYEMHRTLSRAFAENDTARPSRFLWRLEQVDAVQGAAMLLVQSEEQGRWQKLSAGYCLSLADKPLDLQRLLQDGRRYRFRLLANPTVCRHGKRYGLADEAQQQAWLHRQLQQAGSVVQSVMRTRSEKWAVRKQGHVMTLQAAGFEGVLAVDDAALLRAAIGQGLGHARSLGLGLLSVAPV